uniref:Armadillo repeat-containing protein 8 n=1 Tax=Periophthalmus magnuspinnatus TaxID=409849 RepID=A0A3B3ZUS3_9GOBI
MFTATSRHYVDRLFDPDPQKVLQGVIDMKNAVIGNNKQKANLIVLGAVPRLLYLLQQSCSSLELRTECAIVLGSLAMGTENNIKSLVDCHIIPALFQGLLCLDLIFIEACLRCLRTVFISPVTPRSAHYYYYCNIKSATLPCNYWHISYSQNRRNTFLAYENTQVSLTLVNVLVDGEVLSQVFVKMMQRDQPIEMQLTAAKCLTYMCRAGAIRTDDSCIVLKVEPLFTKHE